MGSGFWNRVPNWVIPGAIAVVGFFFWLRAHDAEIRWETTAKRSQDSVAVIMREVKEKDEIIALHDKEHKVLEDSIKKYKKQVKAEQVKTEMATDDMVAMLRIQVPQAAAIIDSLAMTIHKERQVAADLHQADSTLLMAERRRVFERDEQLKSYREINEEIQKQLDKCIKHKTRGDTFVKAGIAVGAFILGRTLP